MNIFREANQLLDRKDSGAKLTEEELELVNTATIPFTVNTDHIFGNKTIAEGLEKLAKMIDGER